MCNMIGMVAALGLHQPANRGKGSDWVGAVNERATIGTKGLGSVQNKSGSGRDRVMVAGVETFGPPQAEEPPAFSRLF